MHLPFLLVFTFLMSIEVLGILVLKMISAGSKDEISNLYKNLMMVLTV